MDGFPAVYVLLTTYKRTELAIKTIQALKRNLVYPNYGWIIVDDGTGGDHLDRLIAEIGSGYYIFTHDSQRRGVGYGMNWGLRKAWDIGADLVLMMEDDWDLTDPVELKPYVDTLVKHPEHGLIRFGYLSPGLQANLISEEGKLFWRLENNNYTYRYAGHPSLRHKRFHAIYGMFDEGLAPGATELSMCGKVNTRQGPNILYPAECGQWGFFAHIGAESLKDIKPGGR